MTAPRPVVARVVRFRERGRPVKTPQLSSDRRPSSISPSSSGTARLRGGSRRFRDRICRVGDHQVRVAGGWAGNGAGVLPGGVGPVAQGERAGGDAGGGGGGLGAGGVPCVKQWGAPVPPGGAGLEQKTSLLRSSQPNDGFVPFGTASAARAPRSGGSSSRRRPRLRASAIPQDSGATLRIWVAESNVLDASAAARKDRSQVQYKLDAPRESLAW